MRPRRANSLLAILAVCVLLGTVRIARADNTSDPRAQRKWVILPVRSEHAPPRDPTLLRLSAELHAAVKVAISAAGISAEAILAERDVRDDHCPSIDAECPLDMPDKLTAERVVSWKLENNHRRVIARIYGPRRRRTSFSLSCQWDDGLVRCNTEPIQSRVAREAKRIAGVNVLSAPHATKAVEHVFEQKKAALVACKRRYPEASSAPVRGLPAAPQVRFRVDESGRVTEVRLEPRGLDDVPAYACMARVVESIHIKAHVSKDQVFVLSLP